MYRDGVYRDGMYRDGVYRNGMYRNGYEIVHKGQRFCCGANIWTTPPRYCEPLSCILHKEVPTTAIISSPAVFPSDPPTITQAPLSQTAHLHSPVQFQCVADGNPDPLVMWNFQGNPIAGAQGNIFTIAMAAGDNVGEYTCVTTNSVGEDSATAALTVLCEWLGIEAVNLDIDLNSVRN